MVDTSPISGITRRELFRHGAAGALSLAPLLAARPGIAAISGAPKPGQAQAVILIWLDGGPSQLETFDPRPDAASGLCGPLGAIKTSVPGTAVSSLMPRMARLMDRVTLIRALSHSEPSHDRACRALLTVSTEGTALAGTIPPSLGSYAAMRLGPRSDGAHPYVVIGDRGFARGYGRTGTLGAQFEPRVIGAEAVSRNRSKRRDRAAIRERYGRHAFGESCLAANHLIEDGARFVTVSYGGWDTHSDAVEAARERLVPALDQGLSALLEDLSRCGRLGETLVVVMGEFGRTARLNALGGRDHDPTGGFALLAGAGTVGGQVIGGVNGGTGEPCRDITTPDGLKSMILAKLGISQPCT